MARRASCNTYTTPAQKTCQYLFGNTFYDNRLRHDYGDRNSSTDTTNGPEINARNTDMNWHCFVLHESSTSWIATWSIHKWHHVRLTDWLRMYRTKLRIRVFDQKHHDGFTRGCFDIHRQCRQYMQNFSSQNWSTSVYVVESNDRSNGGRMRRNTVRCHRSRPHCRYYSIPCLLPD